MSQQHLSSQHLSILHLSERKLLKVRFIVPFLTDHKSQEDKIVLVTIVTPPKVLRILAFADLFLYIFSYKHLFAPNILIS